MVDIPPEHTAPIEQPFMGNMNSYIHKLYMSRDKNSEYAYDFRVVDEELKVTLRYPKADEDMLQLSTFSKEIANIRMKYDFSNNPSEIEILMNRVMKEIQPGLKQIFKRVGMLNVFTSKEIKLIRSVFTITNSDLTQLLLEGEGAKVNNQSDRLIESYQKVIHIVQNRLIEKQSSLNTDGSFEVAINQHSYALEKLINVLNAQVYSYAGIDSLIDTNMNVDEIDQLLDVNGFNAPSNN